MNELATSIQVWINGEARAIPASTALADLINGLGLPPQTALVEHNGQALLRSEWPGRSLAEGDRLEVLRVVAGG